MTEELIRRMPKAELHIHLEGCMTAPLLRELSRKYSTQCSRMTGEEIGQLFQYSDFYGFLGTFKIVTEHLRTPADYLKVFDWVVEYLERENIRYLEMICSPAIPWHYGYDGEAILDALLEASAAVEPRYKRRIRWILDCVRSLGRESAERTVDLAYRYRSRGVVAIGLGGDENSHNAEEYAPVFSWAKAHQLFVHAHAGEAGGPSHIWSALQVLGANRIGHGIQAARDPELMDYLKTHAVALDVCLTSNRKTRVWPMLANHPFLLFLRRGVPVTLNTDDPGLFGTGLTEEYEKAVRYFSLNRDDLVRIALQGARSSFLPHDEKLAMMQEFQSEIQALGF
jgi:aminodeoxyfutalosine deaminase